MQVKDGLIILGVLLVAAPFVAWGVGLVDLPELLKFKSSVPPPVKGLEGIASWYGPRFHGRKTANGEIYNMHADTAAHKTLPFNTWVRVTNLENGKETVVRINDRGPFIEGRIIDLSKKAAQEIDMIGPGHVPVRLVIIEKPPK